MKEIKNDIGAVQQDMHHDNIIDDDEGIGEKTKTTRYFVIKNDCIGNKFQRNSYCRM